MIDIRQRVKDLCKEKGITQKEVASKMGISEIGLSMALRPDRKVRKKNDSGEIVEETKDRYPSLETLERIASILCVPLWELLKDDAAPASQSLTCPHCGKEIKINISAE